MRKVLIDQFYQKVKGGTPLDSIPKPYQVKVQRLLDGAKDEPKKNIEVPLRSD